MKLIFTLAKSAKLNLGLNHKALKTIYLSGILPLLLYGTPIWVKAMTLKSYKDKIIRVQRIINIKIAKAYRTVANEARCVLTGLAPIAINVEEMTKLYELTKVSSNKKNVIVENDMEVKHRQHPADAITRMLEDTDERRLIQIYTDGSKTEKGVGAGTAFFESGLQLNNMQCRLKSCINNQAEQLTILTALKHTENMQTTEKTVTIYTDSLTTLESLRNSNITTFLIEEIRRQLSGVTTKTLKIELR